MNISNFIVCHNIKSFNYFIKNNEDADHLYNYMIVGDLEKLRKFYFDINLQYPVFLAAMFDKEIEKYHTLLSFTAWYCISRNRLAKSGYVGIFEYDVIFKKSINPKMLKPDTIIGFNRRNLPDKMFLDLVPGFTKLLKPEEKQKADELPFWSAGSNLIMPVKFMDEFVNWYMNFIPGILAYDNHPHFHERAINVFAAIKGYKIETIDLIEHKNLNSHGISCI